MRRLAALSSPLTENDVLDLHRVILTGIQTEDAGVYRRDRVVGRTTGQRGVAK